MSTMKKELHFNLEGTTPHTLPMARLADYLKELAKLLGSEDKVHFLRVDEGSADCAMEVAEEEQTIISERIHSAKNGEGPKEAIKAFQNIRYFLDEDDISAVMEWEDGDTIWEFLKKSEEGQVTFGPFWEEGSLDGMLVKIGGLDETVPVHLAYQGVHHTCNTTRDIARKMAPYLFGKPIRVSGKGKWYRNAEGKWELRWFDIRQFEELSDASLLDVVGRLRSIPDNDLMKSKDPLGDMLKIRHR
jgi:hypothetical protein